MVRNLFQALFKHISLPSINCTFHNIYANPDFQIYQHEHKRLLLLDLHQVRYYS